MCYTSDNKVLEVLPAQYPVVATFTICWKVVSALTLQVYSDVYKTEYYPKKKKFRCPDILLIFCEVR